VIGLSQIVSVSLIPITKMEVGRKYLGIGNLNVYKKKASEDKKKY